MYQHKVSLLIPGVKLCFSKKTEFSRYFHTWPFRAYYATGEKCLVRVKRSTNVICLAVDKITEQEVIKKGSWHGRSVHPRNACRNP
jgi:hypothetical protein